MEDNRDLVLSSVGREFIGNESHRNHYSLFLSAAQKNVLFGVQKGSCMNELVSQIHICLNSSATRLEGLLLLYKFLQQCTTEALMEHVKTWTNLLMAILQSHNSIMVYEMCCCVVELLLQSATTFSEINREFSTSFVPMLLPLLLAAQHQWMQSAIKCLTNCMAYFPGPCGNYKTKIESFITPWLSGETTDFVEVAARAFAVLGRCGGGGNLGVKHVESWTAYCNKLIGTLHDTVDKLYQEFEINTVAHSSPSSSIEFGPIESKEPQRSLILVTRLHGVCQSLINMLTLEYPSVVRVPQKDMIAVVCRILALTPKQLMVRPTKQKIVLSSQMSAIHSDALDILQALTKCCMGHLIPHQRIINKSLVQSLDWSLSNDELYGANKPLSNFRSKLYSTLVVWMESLGASCGLDMYSSDICGHLVRDIVPQVDTVKVDSKTTSKNIVLRDNVGGKKKKKSHSAVSGHMSSNRKLDTFANNDVCLAALQMVKSMLGKIGCFLKSRDHKKMQEAIISAAVALETEPDRPAIPYGDPTCRKALYEALLMLVISPSTEWPPPMQCAVAIFRSGCHDANPQVSNICAEALKLCETILHPRAPSFNAPVFYRWEHASDEAEAKIQTQTVLMEKTDSLDDSLINPEIRTELDLPKTLETSYESTSSPNQQEFAEIPENGHESESNQMEIQDIDSTEEPRESSGDTENNPSCVTAHLDDSNKDETVRRDDISDYQDANSKLENSPKEESDYVEDATIDGGEDEACQIAKRKLEDTYSEHERMSKKMQTEECPDTTDNMLADFVDAEPDSE